MVVVKFKLHNRKAVEKNLRNWRNEILDKSDQSDK